METNMKLSLFFTASLLLSLGCNQQAAPNNKPSGEKQIVIDCDRNNWMSAAEAKAYGLVDEIIDKRK